MAIYPPNTTNPKPGNYLWNWLGSPIKKFAAALSPYISGGGGGGGGGVTEVTYTELQTLISGGTLVPGVTYKITGFNKNMPSGGPGNLDGYLPEVLYDDGTNSGVTIYMQALSTTEMVTSGYGEFYNPIYGDQTTYTNTDGTGLYRIWDGDNPDPLQVPEYVIGDVVFWGGYAWENISGNVGNAIDIVTLSAIDWVKLPYSNTTWYTKVTDEIKVDWNNGIVVERYNPENQIRVAYNSDQYSWWLGYYTAQVSPISVMAWGLYSKITSEGLDDNFYGISNLEVINSWMETVSFKGAGLLNVYIDASGFYSNYIGLNSYIAEIIMEVFSSIHGNEIISSSIGTCRILTGNISLNIVTQSSFINTIIIIRSSVEFNTLYLASIIANNQLSNFSTIDNNTLNDSSITTNIVNNDSHIQNNILSGNISIQLNCIEISSSIGSNTMSGGYIRSNTLNNNSFIGYFTTNLIDIQENMLTNGVLSGSSSGTLTNKTIQNNTIRNAAVQSNLTLATHIYGNYSKDIISRPDIGTRICYVSNANVLTIVADNA